MNDMHGILLAYGSAVGMRELTERRTAAAVPVLSRYRAVDFMLSNMKNAGITDIGLVMRDNYQSLLDHVGSGKDWDLSRKRGGLRILPPFGMTSISGRDGFRGKMEALASIYTYIGEIRQKYVLLADGDIILNIDLNDVLRHHIEKGADLTAVCTAPGTLPSADAHFTFGEDSFLTDVVTRSEMRDDYGASGNGTAGIYVMSKELMLDIVQQYSSRSLFSFERDVLHQLYGTLKISGYIFSGFCSKIYNTTAYFTDSMKLLNGDIRRDLFNSDRPIKTVSADSASTYYSPESLVKNSLVADGCHIDGVVENCVLFRGVRVEEGTVLKDCVVMQDTVIRGDTHISYAIIDKNVTVNRGRELMGHYTYPLVISKESVV